MVQIAYRPRRAGSRRGRRQVKELWIISPICGKVLNLSPLGMAIEALEGLTIGQYYSFLLRRGSHNIRNGGTVRWCALVKTEREKAGTVHPVYQAGIAFKVPGPSTLRFLERC